MAHSFGGRAAKAGYGMCVGRRRFDVDGTELEVSVMHQDQVLTPPQTRRSLARLIIAPML